MTWNSERLAISKPDKPKKIIQPENLAGDSEHSQQVALFCWIGLQTDYPQLKWLFAIPNGFFGTSAQKGKMKAEGLRTGVYDLFLPITTELTGYAGLFIEMKREKYRKTDNGGLTDEQVEFGNHVASERYKTAVCYNWIEAKNTLIEYLKGEC